jgi:hypothetical protein
MASGTLPRQQRERRLGKRLEINEQRQGGGKRDDSAPLGASEDELERAELEKNALDPSRQFVFE